MGTAVSVVGPYQSDAGWVLRSWGQANSDTLVRYIQANVEGIRWALNPANRAALVKLLSERFKMAPDVVEGGCAARSTRTASRSMPRST